MTPFIILYLLGVAGVGVSALVGWSTPMSEEDRRWHARLFVRSPLWPLLLLRLIGQVVLDAFGGRDG